MTSCWQQLISSSFKFKLPLSSVSKIESLSTSRSDRRTRESSSDSFMNILKKKVRKAKEVIRLLTDQGTEEKFTMPPRVYKQVNVLVLGAEQVGKTSLIKSLIGDEFDEHQEPTLHDLYETQVECEHGYFVFKFTDLSGTQSFSSSTQIEISKTDICLIVYSLEDIRTVDIAKRLKEEIETFEQKSGREVPYIVVGNKVDSYWEESQENQELIVFKSNCNELDDTCVSHILTSAKTRVNVSNLLKTLSSEGEALNLSQCGFSLRNSGQICERYVIKT